MLVKSHITVEPWAIQGDQPKEPSRLFGCYQGSEMSLNMIDAHDPAYIPKSLVNTALAFISDNLDKGLKVLLHCNQGMSRSPGIALLFLAKKMVNSQDYPMTRQKLSFEKSIQISFLQEEWMVFFVD